MRKVYNQKNMSLTIDGVNIQDFHEGATFVYTWDGGEVDKTQGTDGAGINIATNQGATLQFTLRETSRSIKFLSDLRLRQENGGAGVTVSPVCFLIITKDGSASILGINAQADSTVDRLVEMIPGAINRVSSFVEGFSGKKKAPADESAPMEGGEE